MDLAERFGAPVLTHLAESPGEMAMVRERFGTTPVRHLAALGLLRGSLTAAHCVWVDEEEIGMLANRGVGIAHCAESNMKLGSGIAPVPRMLAAGIAVGLGTDGAASNNDLDLFGEMGTVPKLHKVASGDPTAAPAREVLRMATLGGAAALHMEKEIGSLEPGKKADVILVGTSGPGTLPLCDPYSYLVYSARSDAVETVIVDGKVLMHRHRFLTLDTARVRRDAGRFGRKIASALPE